MRPHQTQQEEAPGSRAGRGAHLGSGWRPDSSAGVGGGEPAPSLPSAPKAVTHRPEPRAEVSSPSPAPGGGASGPAGRLRPAPLPECAVPRRACVVCLVLGASCHSPLDEDSRVPHLAPPGLLVGSRGPTLPARSPVSCGPPRDPRLGARAWHGAPSGPRVRAPARGGDGDCGHG